MFELRMAQERKRLRHDIKEMNQREPGLLMQYWSLMRMWPDFALCVCLLISGPIGIIDSDDEDLGTVGAEAMAIQASEKEGLTVQTHAKGMEAEETQAIDASESLTMQTAAKPDYADPCKAAGS